MECSTSLSQASSDPNRGFVSCLKLCLDPMQVHHPGPIHTMSHPWPGISQTNANMSVGGGWKVSVTADIGFQSTCDVDKLTICKQGPASVVFTHRTQTLSWGIYSRPHRRNTTVKQHSAIKFLSPLPSMHSMCGPRISIWFCFASVGARISKYHRDKSRGKKVIHHFVLYWAVSPSRIGDDLITLI